jgi:hypothetical protein
MDDLRTKFDLARINTLAEDMPPVDLTLSDTTRLLCLDLLSRFPCERWSWLNDGQKMTDPEWDEAQAMVDLAIWELIE